MFSVEELKMSFQCLFLKLWEATYPNRCHAENLFFAYSYFLLLFFYFLAHSHSHADLFIRMKKLIFCQKNAIVMLFFTPNLFTLLGTPRCEQAVIRTIWGSSSLSEAKQNERFTFRVLIVGNCQPNTSFCLHVSILWSSRKSSYCFTELIPSQKTSLLPYCLF